MVLITNNQFMWTLSASFLFGWIVYRFTKKIPANNFLVWFHVLATLTVFMFIIVNIKFYPKSAAENHVQAILMRTISNGMVMHLPFKLSVLLTFILAQLAYVVNVVMGLKKRAMFKKITTKNTGN